MLGALPMVVAANPMLTDKVLAGAGRLAGLAQADIRQLEQASIPSWAVLAAGIAIGAAVGGYAGFRIGVWAAGRKP